MRVCQWVWVGVELPMNLVTMMCTISEGKTYYHSHIVLVFLPEALVVAHYYIQHGKIDITYHALPSYLQLDVGIALPKCGQLLP
jgi:hypothetical protein